MAVVQITQYLTLRKINLQSIKSRSGEQFWPLEARVK